MIIKTEGQLPLIVKQTPWWVGKTFVCGHCKTEFVLEEADVDMVTESFFHGTDTDRVQRKQAHVTCPTDNCVETLTAVEVQTT